MIYGTDLECRTEYDAGSDGLWVHTETLMAQAKATIGTAQLGWSAASGRRAKVTPGRVAAGMGPLSTGPALAR